MSQEEIEKLEVAIAVQNTHVREKEGNEFVD